MPAAAAAAAVPQSQLPENKEALHRKFLPGLVSPGGGRWGEICKLTVVCRCRANKGGGKKYEISGVEIFNISFEHFYRGDHDKYFVGCISATNHRQAGI